MSDQQINWTSFTKRIVIKRPVEEVLAAWAIPSKLETWFLEKATYYNNSIIKDPDSMVQKGDKFMWKWNNWDYEEKGEVLDVTDNQISFTFGKGGNVNVKLQETDNGTEIELIQDNIPTDEKSKYELYVGCITGWTFWLANLKAWLEFNVTLHEKGLVQGQTKNLVNS